MKKIFLIRHAKSDWSIEGIPDIDRPLNQRGYSDAHLMAPHLKNLLPPNSFWISSPATRALTTALIFARELAFAQENIALRPALYEADVNNYLDQIHAVDDSYEAVLLFGHNPTISDVFEKLNESIGRDLPTCAVSEFEVACEKWKDVIASMAKMKLLIYPSLFKGDKGTPGSNIVE